MLHNVYEYHTDPSNYRRHCSEKGTFVHWLYMYIAEFVTASSSYNTAGLNLTYLL